MEKQEIIGSILEIFERFRIPQNLRDHMFRAAAVGELICDNWNGPELDKDAIVAVLLLHDLGNLVKMKFDTPLALKIMGKEAERVEYWKKVKQEVVEKYGKDDHRVTMKMVAELGVSERLVFLLNEKEWLQNSITAASDDFDLKICSYADQRIGPFGILSLRVRFEDVAERYKDMPKHYSQEPSYAKIVAYGLELEKQIFEHCSITLEQVTDDAVQRYIDKYAK